MENNYFFYLIQSILLFCFFTTVNLHGQSLAPAVKDNNEATAPSVTSGNLDMLSSCLNGCDRQAIIDDYIINYLGSSFNTAEMAWTGDIATCNPGTISNTVHQKILQRINYFRRLACVSDDIYFDAVKNGKCQESALMQQANDGLSHCNGVNNAPCDTWLCNTPNAIEAAQNSNIVTNWNYANPIDMYMEDSGNSNEAVGHRRWILFSRGNEMGNGITPNKQILWVLGNYAATPTYNNFIVYPSAGFFPRSLVYKRWSFGIPGANFSNATVEMKRNGEAISATIISSTANYGDPTLVWNVASSDLTFPTDEDVEFDITVTGVTGATESTYNYKVIAIKEVMPSFSFEQTDPYCNDNGIATAHFSAGAKSYYWMPGEDTTQTIMNLATGTYYLTATDKFGCESLDSVILVTDTITTPHPGNATPATLQSISETGNLLVSTTGTLLKKDEATGWWITKTNPISLTITDQASLDTAISTANIEPHNNSFAINTNPNVLFLNDSLSNGIAYDCNNMDGSATYYATPFVTSYRVMIPDTNCIATNGSIGNISVGGRPGKFTSIPPSVIDCRPDSLLGLPVYNLEVTISGYTGPVGELGILIQDNNYTGNTILYAPYLSGNGTFTFSNNDFTYYIPNDPGDPNWTTGLTVLSWQLSGNGMQAGNIELALNITYPGDPGIPFPTMTYSSCIFGDPVPFVCSSCSAPSNIPTTVGTYHATNECTDASGWTHYWDNVDGTNGNSDDLFLLSIKKDGNDIGAIGDGVFDLFINVGDNNNGDAIHIPETVPYVTNIEGWFIMDRYWFVTPTSQPTSPVAVRFYYTTDDYDDIRNAPGVDPLGHESLTFYKTLEDADPNPGSGHVGVTASQINFYNTEGIDWQYTGEAFQNYHTAELFTVSSFSGGGGGASNCEGCGPLPVELISFTGKLKNDKVYLEWKTSSEPGNDYFSLEHSTDGIHFDLFATVPGNGNSIEIQQYFYIDEQPEEGTNYYRLSQIDYDGTSRFAGNVAVVVYQKKKLVSIYPNPTSKELNIRIGENSMASSYLDYKLFDTLGRLVGQGRFDRSNSEAVFKLDVNRFSNGLYLLQFTDGTANQVVSFLKR